MKLIFGNEKELIQDYQFLIDKVLPSLNTCKFCNKLKCEYCKSYSVNCNMCKKVRCFNCSRFNKSKDILINSKNILILSIIFSNYFWFIKAGFDLGSKDISSEFGKKLINKGIDNIPNLFKFGASKITNKNVKRALNSEIANLVVNEAQGRARKKYNSTNLFG